MIWYAAYGSNLSRARFDCYLAGGRPDGAAHIYPGCRDATSPEAEAAVEIGAELVFGGTSQTWGGGVAFVEARSGTAKARLYLVTLDQFADVVAQENWLEPGEVTFDGVPDGLIVLDGPHVYRLVLRLADHEGLPVLTVSQPAGTATAPPSAAYLRHIAAGLFESHGLSAEDAVAYLASKRGIAEALSPDDIAAALRGITGEP